MDAFHAATTHFDVAIQAITVTPARSEPTARVKLAVITHLIDVDDRPSAAAVLASLSRDMLDDSDAIPVRLVT